MDQQPACQYLLCMFTDFWPLMCSDTNVYLCKQWPYIVIKSGQACWQWKRNTARPLPDPARKGMHNEYVTVSGLSCHWLDFSQTNEVITSVPVSQLEISTSSCSTHHKCWMLCSLFEHSANCCLHHKQLLCVQLHPDVSKLEVFESSLACKSA